MSSSNIKIITELAPKQANEKLNKKMYGDYFYLHLNNLFSFKYRANHLKYKNLILDTSFYNGMTQLAFESSELVETEKPSEIDWASVKRNTYNFVDRIDSVFKKSMEKDYYNNYIENTIDSIENYYIYEYMHSNSIFNPWKPFLNIYHNGFIFRKEDDPGKITKLNKLKKSDQDFDIQSPLQFIVRGEKDKSSRMVIGSRYHFQLMILDYLTHKKTSHTKPIPLRKMEEFLSNQGYNIKQDTIQINITAPLKKTGLIGSTLEGFFMINNYDDLKASYCFHYKKNISIVNILEKYKTIARNKFNIDDMDNKC